MKALYQIGYAFFGVGETGEEAMNDAKEWLDGPVEVKEPTAAVNGDFILVDVSDKLANAIKNLGGNIPHGELSTGVFGTIEEVR